MHLINFIFVTANYIRSYMFFKYVNFHGHMHKTSVFTAL